MPTNRTVNTFTPSGTHHMSATPTILPASVTELIGVVVIFVLAPVVTTIAAAKKWGSRNAPDVSVTLPSGTDAAPQVVNLAGMSPQLVQVVTSLSSVVTDLLAKVAGLEAERADYRETNGILAAALHEQHEWQMAGAKPPPPAVQPHVIDIIGHLLGAAPGTPRQ